MSAWSNDGRRPDVDEQKTASVAAARSARARRAAFNPSRSGASSCTKSAPPPAPPTLVTISSRPPAAGAACARWPHARREFSSTSAIFSAARGSGSYTRTSTPLRRKRAAQPPPMTPPPRRPTARGRPASRSATAREPQLRPHLGGGEDAHVHRAQDLRRPLHQLRVGGVHAPLEHEVVLEADADVAADPGRHRHERQLHAPDRERREHRVARKLVPHREQRAGVVGGAIGDTGAELDQRWRVDQAVGDHLLHHHQVARVEDLELGPHAELLDPLRHRPQHPGRVHHDVVAAGGEVHRAAVERADLGTQLGDVAQALLGPGHVGAGGVRRERLVLPAEDEIAAHPRGQVEHDVDVGGPHSLDHLPVELRIAGALARLGIADVDVCDRRARPGRLDGGVRDLFGRNRHQRAAAGGVAGARDGARDEDLPVHRRPPMDAMGTPCYRGPRGRPYDARVRRLIALVCVLVVFDLALWSAVVPLLPHYRHALGLSTLQAAWILAAFSLAVIVVAVPMGHLADRVGPRLVTLIGTLSMAAATAGLGLAHTFPELMVARVFQGAADAAVWGAGLAWVAARAPLERRGESVGYAQVAATLGVITGPFIGGVVTTTFGIRATFLGMTALFVILLALIAVEPDARMEDHRRTSMAWALRASLGESLITASVGMILVVALVGGALQLLVPLHLSSLGVDRSGIGLVYSVGAVLGGGAVVITARVGDQVGRVPLAAGACAALAILTAGFTLPAGIGVFVGLVIAASAAQSILYAVGYPLSTDGADRAQLGHGVVLGVVNLMWGIGAVVGPVAGSRLADWQGTRASYALLAVICATTAVLFVRSQRAPEPEAEAEAEA